MFPVIPLAIMVAIFAAIAERGETTEGCTSPESCQALWRFVASRNPIPPAWVMDRGDHYEVAFQGGCVVGTLNPRIPRSWEGKPTRLVTHYGIVATQPPTGAWVPDTTIPSSLP